MILNNKLSFSLKKLFYKFSLQKVKQSAFSTFISGFFKHRSLKKPLNITLEAFLAFLSHSQFRPEKGVSWFICMLWPSQAKVDAELSNQAKKTLLLQLRFILRSVSATFAPVFIVKKQSCSLDRIPNLLLMGTESIDVSFGRLSGRLGSNHVMIIPRRPGTL